MSQSRSIRARFLRAAVFGSCVAAGPMALGVNNVVINPSFETPSPNGWGAFASYAYSQNYTGAAPAGAGARYFTGTPGQASSTKVQTISLAGRDAAIDSGSATFNLGAFFSTYLTQNDHTAITATFRDESGATVGTTTIGGLAFVQSLGTVGSPTLAGARAWAEDARTAAIPVGARSIDLSMLTTRLAGGAADGYVDLVNLQINAPAVQPGANLVANPSFEAASPTGWTAFSTYAYSQGYTGAAPAGAGLRYFTGTSGLVEQTHSQTIDLSGRESQIDAGGVDYDLSAFFGSYRTQNDHSSIIATFLDGSGNVLATDTIGGLAFIQSLGFEGIEKSWGFDGHIGDLPIGTRLVQLTISTTRLAGGAADGYVDNVHFSLIAIPEPGMLTFAALGAGLLACVRRRRA